MEDDKEHPGSRKTDGDGGIKAPTLGQSTPFVEETVLIHSYSTFSLIERPPPDLQPLRLGSPHQQRPLLQQGTSHLQRPLYHLGSPCLQWPLLWLGTPHPQLPLLQLKSPHRQWPLLWLGSPHLQLPLLQLRSPHLQQPLLQLGFHHLQLPLLQLWTHSTDLLEVGLEEKDMHPRNVLEALGEDINGETLLRDHYHFYAWTRYPVNKVVVARNRMTGGTQCWSQGGGKEPVRNDKEGGKHQESLIGWKRKFNFVGNPGKRPIESIKIGSQSYTFKLEELVTAEDEEEEKQKMGEKRTPQSFLCIYRLKATLKPTNDHHQSCRVANPGHDGQNSPLVLPSSAQPLTGQQDFQ